MEGGGGGGTGGMGFKDGNVLDPSAQEFHPSAHHFALLQPQIYYPYPPPPPPPPPPIPLPLPHFFPQAQTPLATTTTSSRPAYVSHGPTEALPDAVPTRSLLLSSVPLQVTEGVVRMELEGFGGVRAVDMSRLGEGIVVVHFYDLRSARSAMEAVREQHVRQQGRLWQQFQQCGVGVGNWAAAGWEIGGGGGGEAVVMVGRGMIAGRAVWAQFAPEVTGADGPNNGSLVVFNLDPGVSSTALKEVFEAFGAVKETRETPMKPRHRFVEFYDTRDAARALVELDGKEIFGKKIVIEFSRPGGHGRSNYCRRSTNHQPSIQLPPRLAVLARTSSSKSSSSSSHGRGGGGSPPQSNEGSGEGLVALDQCMPLKRDGSRSAAAVRSTTSSSKTRGCLPSSSSSKQQQQPSSSRQRGWKNQHGRNRAAAEARFLIKGDYIDGSNSPASRDSRTTVMIKNIPNKYSQKLLLNMLDNHCIHCNEQIVADGDEDREPFSSYDFVYLPIDFNNKCNVGYGFVNMTSPEATWRLYKAFHMQPWEVFNSRKICQITYARLQGLEALMEHFRNSKFACDNDEYMPVVFSPPRDGKNLTDPATIGGRGVCVSSTSSTKILYRASSSAASEDPTEGGGSSTPVSTDLAEEGCADDDDNDSVDDDDCGGSI